MSRAKGQKEGKSKSADIDVFSKNSPENIIRKVFTLYMIMVFPFVMSDKYFNITVTRTKAFLYGALMLFILMLVAFIIEYAVAKYFKGEFTLFSVEEESFFLTPDVYMYIFFVANVFALYMSEDKNNALLGTSGRNFGLLMVLGLTITFFLMSQRCHIDSAFLILLFISTTISNTIGFLQHFGMDPFSLREEISAKQKEMFISTIGNINTYGSYLCIIIGLYFGISVFSKKRWTKIISGLGVFTSSLMIITAKSDDVYIGVAALIAVMFYVATANKKIEEYFRMITVMFSGLSVMSVLNQGLNGSTKHLNGFAKMVERPSIMILVTAIFAVIWILILVIKIIKNELYIKIQNKWVMLLVTLVAILAAIAVTIYGIKNKLELFTFNYKWGTYRGYVWTKAIELFRMGSPMQKLFGYGNESIAMLMRENFYNEMLDITQRTYDNLHNEVLQYLITTGLLGAISYVCLFVSSVRYFIKYLKDTPVVGGCLGATVAYFFQGLVNLNQPITTPYFFFIIAVGVGCVRFRDKK